MVNKGLIAGTDGRIQDHNLPDPLQAAAITPVIAAAKAAVQPSALTTALNGVAKVPTGGKLIVSIDSTSVNDPRPGGSSSTYKVFWFLIGYSTQPANFLSDVDEYFIVQTS